MPVSLIIETSTAEGSICLVGSDGALVEKEFGSDRRHNSALFKPLHQLLEDAGEVDLVLVGSGPGSYSGTRVGIAAAQGVAIAMGCPAVAVPSVLAIEPVAEGRCCLIVGDARRGSLWSSRLDGGTMNIPLLEDLESWTQTVLKAYSEGCELVSLEDEGYWNLPDRVKIRKVVPKASLLWKAWTCADTAQRCNWEATSPQPMYLKPPHITKAKRKILGKST